MHLVQYFKMHFVQYNKTDISSLFFSCFLSFLRYIFSDIIKLIYHIYKSDISSLFFSRFLSSLRCSLNDIINLIYQIN